MPDIQKHIQTKERILEIIKQGGPDFPVRVANAIGGNNLFTAAFMSELVSEQKLKISAMRVGSSPLYYIPGQEEQLQKYSEYLNQKEREAFKILKENKILKDDELEPAIRVALRSIKDFAVPIQTTNNSEIKIFWKLHTISNEEAKNIIELKITPKIEEKIKKELQRETEKENIEKTENKLEKKETNEQPENTLNILNNPKDKLKKLRVQKQINSNFLTNLKSILEEKNFEILSELSIKKKEYTAKIRTDTHLGKQEFYLVAKEKKRITADDLTLALQKAQGEKMPALIMSTGEIDKKASEYYKEWRNLIKHEKISM